MCGLNRPYDAGSDRTFDLSHPQDDALIGSLLSGHAMVRGQERAESNQLSRASWPRNPRRMIDTMVSRAAGSSGEIKVWS